MKIAFSDFDADRSAFDTVIDVRSSAEFAEDHIPGAINLPVLSNEERAEVGTIYVQDDPFKARKIGAALVARNTAGHLQTALKDQPGGWRPLVYCWRGGQRSGSFATILKEIGWQVRVLDGGYKSYRRAVQTRLYETALPHRFVILDGNTGTAKTELIHRLGQRGVQSLDLEGLANHRGSLFGHRDGGQPGQKAFESELAESLRRLDPTKPTVVEAESSRIGRLNVPPAVWKRMEDAPRIVIAAPLGARARFLARVYGDIVADFDRLADRLDALKPYQSKDSIERWRALAEAGEHETLAAELMEQHYDPRYGRERDRHDRETLARLDTVSLEPEALETLADQLASVVLET
jgi:tRNA 2-selenouridine synthase